MLDAKNAAGRAGGANLPKNASPRHMRLYAPAMAYWPLAVVSGRRPARRWPVKSARGPVISGQKPQKSAIFPRFSRRRPRRA